MSTTKLAGKKFIQDQILSQGNMPVQLSSKEGLSETAVKVGRDSSWWQLQSSAVFKILLAHSHKPEGCVNNVFKPAHYAVMAVNWLM